MDLWKQTLAALIFASFRVIAQNQPNVLAWDGNGTVQTNVPSDLTNAVSVAAGYQHVLALRADGTVVAWGDNAKGQTNVPAGLSNVVAISAGGIHNLALRADHTLVAWGTNIYGEATVPAGLDDIVGIASGFYHNLALRADGTVIAWGTNFFGESTVPHGLNNVVAIAAGDNHNLALRADGTVVSWGMYLGLEYWYPMVTPAGLSNVVAVAAGASHCLALKADGTLVVWGDSRYGQWAIPDGLSNVVAIAASGGHNLALRTDGTVVAFGFSQAVPAGLSTVVGIADGAYSLAVVGSGPPAAGPPPVDRALAQGAGTATFYAPAVGGWPLSYQWQCNGTNVPNATNAWLVINSPPPLHSGLYSVTVSNEWGKSVTQSGRLTVEPAVFNQPPADQVAYLGGTAKFGLGVQASQPATYQWRFNDKDLSGETNSELVLQNVTRDNQGLYSVIVSNQFGSVLSPTARLWVVNVAGWGANYTSEPFYGGQAVAPESLSNAVAIGAGETHSLALRADGTVEAWGSNQNGETNVPANLTRVVAIAAGNNHNIALLRDGKTVAWGADWSGQAEVPTDLSNVVAIAAGGYHSLALRADGTVVAWGGNDYGQTDVPAGLSNVVAIACGGAHSLALCADGTIVGWGRYQHFSSIPPFYQWLPMEPPVVIGLPFIQLGSGLSHGLAVLTGGSAFAWGEDRFGQTDVPWWLTDVVATDGGDYHSLALRTNGTVVAWGDNSIGQTNVPSDLHNAIAIAAGGWHNLALIGVGPPVLSSSLLNPTFRSGTFSVSMPSQSGRVYALEYKDSLDDTLWKTLPLTAGNGTNVTMADATAPTHGARYYRVRRW